MLNVYPARRIHYAQPVRPFAEAADLRSPRTIGEMKKIWYEISDAADEQVGRYNTSRYTELNLNSYFFRRTIEFRIFNSTNHAGRLRSYVLLVLALADCAKHYSGLYPLGDMPMKNEEEALIAARGLFDLVGLTENEYRNVREHLTDNVKRYYSRAHERTKHTVIFESFGMNFDGASFAEVLDEMTDNRYFDNPAVRRLLGRIRKRKPIAHKARVVREISQHKTYEEYAGNLIGLLASERLGKLVVID